MSENTYRDIQLYKNDKIRKQVHYWALLKENITHPSGMYGKTKQSHRPFGGSAFRHLDKNKIVKRAFCSSLSFLWRESLQFHSHSKQTFKCKQLGKYEQVIKWDYLCIASKSDKFKLSLSPYYSLSLLPYFLDLFHFSPLAGMD